MPSDEGLQKDTSEMTVDGLSRLNPPDTATDMPGTAGLWCTSLRDIDQWLTAESSTLASLNEHHAALLRQKGSPGEGSSEFWSIAEKCREELQLRSSQLDEISRRFRTRLGSISQQSNGEDTVFFPLLMQAAERFLSIITGPASSALSPVERLRQFIREGWLAA
eukprot:RCo025176